MSNYLNVFLSWSCPYPAVQICSSVWLVKSTFPRQNSNISVCGSISVKWVLSKPRNLQSTSTPQFFRKILELVITKLSRIPVHIVFKVDNKQRLSLAALEFTWEIQLWQFLSSSPFLLLKDIVKNEDKDQKSKENGANVW